MAQRIGLLDRRTIEASRTEADQAGYKRTLGPIDLTGIGIAAIIGSGIFFLLGLEARTTGAAVILSLIVAGAAAALAALSYAEFASVMPGSGSAYAYAFAAFGRLPAFAIGWLFVATYAVGNATVAIAWSEFFNAGLASAGLVLPAALTAAPDQGGLVNVPAMLIVALATVLVMAGTQESARINNVLVALKLLIVLFIIGFGAFFIRPANWAPFAPAGFDGIATSTAALFFAYLGFETVAAAGSEARNPRKHLPIGILASVAIAMALYVLMAGVVTGMSTPDTLAGAAPVANAFAAVGYPWAATVITIGALIAVGTVVFAFHLAMSRILHAMGRDRFVPALFGKLSKTTRTPVNAAVAVGLVAGLSAGLLPLDAVLDLSVLAAIVIYVLVSAGVLVLRRMQPEEAAVRVPSWIHVTAIVFLVAIAAFGLGLLVHLVILAWMGAGLALYGFYSHRASAAAALGRS